MRKMRQRRSAKNNPLPKVWALGNARHVRTHVHACGHQSHNKGFGQRERLTHVVSDERQIRRRPTKNADRIIYSAEMDQFILARYNSKGRWVRTEFYGTGQMKKLAAEFGEKFGIANVRPNQLIGRWNRLQRLDEVEARTRGTRAGVPSLPVLKFMQHGV